MFTISKQLDVSHLNPAQSLLRTLYAVESLETGQVLQLISREQDAVAGIDRLCRQTGLILMQYTDWDGEFTFLVRKAGGEVNQPITLASSEPNPVGRQTPDVHSGSVNQACQLPSRCQLCH